MKVTQTIELTDKERLTVIEHHEQVKSVLKVIYNWLTKLEEADNDSSIS